MAHAFARASPEHIDLILAWLEKGHVRQFWDNSREHKDDLRIFVEGRKKASPYFGGIFDYWVGSYNAEPFCLLMTSHLLPEDELPEIWKRHLSETGKSLSVDFFIGDERFLGQGLAADTLLAFVRFFCSAVERDADAFFIDPALDNPRAQHVYAKAGFVPIGTYVVRSGIFEGKENLLMVLRVQ